MENQNEDRIKEILNNILISIGISGLALPILALFVYISWEATVSNIIVNKTLIPEIITYWQSIKIVFSLYVIVGYVVLYRKVQKELLKTVMKVKEVSFRMVMYIMMTFVFIFPIQTWIDIIWLRIINEILGKSMISVQYNTLSTLRVTILLSLLLYLTIGLIDLCKFLFAYLTGNNHKEVVSA